MVKNRIFILFFFLKIFAFNSFASDWYLDDDSTNLFPQEINTQNEQNLIQNDHFKKTNVDTQNENLINNVDQKNVIKKLKKKIKKVIKNNKKLKIEKIKLRKNNKNLINENLKLKNTNKEIYKKNFIFSSLLNFTCNDEYLQNQIISKKVNDLLTNELFEKNNCVNKTN